MTLPPLSSCAVMRYMIDLMHKVSGDHDWSINSLRLSLAIIAAPRLGLLTSR